MRRNKLQNLPNELLLNILEFSCLKINNVLTLRQICKDFYIILNDSKWSQKIWLKFRNTNPYKQFLFKFSPAIYLINPKKSEKPIHSLKDYLNLQIEIKTKYDRYFNNQEKCKKLWNLKKKYFENLEDAKLFKYSYIVTFIGSIIFWIIYRDEFMDQLWKDKEYMNVSDYVIIFGLAFLLFISVLFFIAKGIEIIILKPLLIFIEFLLKYDLLNYKKKVNDWKIRNTRSFNRDIGDVVFCSVFIILLLGLFCIKIIFL